MKIVEHTLDLFVLPENKKNAPIRVQIRKNQNASDFQYFPLTVKVFDTVVLFGLYVKFFVLCEEVVVHPVTAKK